MDTHTDGAFPPDLMQAWDRFLREDHINVEDVFNDPVVFPLQRVEEWRVMMQLASATHPRTLVDIGSDKCGGLWLWLKCLPSLRNVVSCEIRGVPCAKLFEKQWPNVRFTWIGGSSRSDAAKLAFKQAMPIDVLFIDGDKSRFIDDFDNCLPCMSDGGIAFMHDITDPAPGEAFEAIAAGRGTAGFSHARMIDTSSAVRSKLLDDAGIPPRTCHEGWLRHWNGRSCGVGVIWM